MSRWGGKRRGAGRPTRESTKVIRVPEKLIESIQRFIQHNKYQLTLYSTKVAAGYPSPADDYVEGTLDLNEYLIKEPESTFCVRVTGDSMVKAGIFPNDILIVDRSINPVHNKIIIAVLNGELTVKRLQQIKNQVFLKPENDGYQTIEVTDEDELTTWGVVTNVIHSL